MGLNKRSTKLLDEYNLSLSCLDYRYIEKSKNAKELENILTVLRSGEEGTFPDLIQFCENKLREVSPGSKLLRKSQGNQVSTAEKKAIEKDLQDWVNEIKECEAKLSSCPGYKPERVSIPVREAADMKHSHENPQGNSEGSSKKLKGDNNQNSFKSPKSQVKPRSYSEWEKFNVEEELEKIDKNTASKTMSTPEALKRKPPLEAFVDASAMTKEERKALAEQEKIKGNEAFKAFDYVEAEIYYTRSVSAYPLPAALNNRALTYIKLKNFTAALCDCNTVLSLEPDNVKALYRRGLVHKETSRFQLAYADFQKVLELEPENKAAKEQLQTMQENPCGIGNRSSVIIEEVNESTTSESNVSHCSSEAGDARTGKTAQGSGDAANVEKQVPESNSMAPSESPNAGDSCSMPRAEKTPDSSKSMCDKETKSEWKQENQGRSACSSDSSANRRIPQSPEKAEKCRSVDGGIQKKEKFVGIPITVCKCKEHNNNQNNSSLASCTLPSELQTSVIISSGGKRSEVTNGNTVHDTESPKTDKEHTKEATVRKELIDSLISNALSEVKGEITPFKFVSLWHSSGADKDHTHGAALLQRIPPAKLPFVLSNKLDGDLLFQLIKAIDIIVQQGEADRGFEYMSNLMKTPRIKTISSFLTGDESTEVQALLQKFQELGKDVTLLRSTFTC